MLVHKKLNWERQSRVRCAHCAHSLKIAKLFRHVQTAGKLVCWMYKNTQRHTALVPGLRRLHHLCEATLVYTV